VQAYLDIFAADDATLWEAGGPSQRGRTVIGNSITHSLGLAPELRHRGTDVAADGAVVMFGQRNEITVAGRTVSYPQIARNVLSPLRRDRRRARRGAGRTGQPGRACAGTFPRRGGRRPAGRLEQR
jgi:hypothetical protein